MTYYQSTVGDPIFYWVINEDEIGLFEGCDEYSLNPIVSDKGDVCHYDIERVGDYHAALYFNAYCRPPNLYACCNGNSIQLSREQYEALEKFRCDD